MNTNGWPGSVLQQQMLLNQIGKFLRTHNDGGSRLLELLDSIPADRTEEEYAALRERVAAEHEAAAKAHLTAYNQRRWAQGQPIIDRQGNPVSTDPIKTDDR